MSDPRREGWSDSTQRMGATGGPLYPPNTDPAYAGPSYGYAPGYQPPPTSATTPLPPYWQQGTNFGGYGASPNEPPPPKGPKGPRWLWAAAAAAVLLVVGLVIALVIVTSSSKESTIVAPLPPLSVSSSIPATTSTTRAATPTTTPSQSSPQIPPATTSTTPTAPSETSTSGTDTVVYTVSGEGRAINITYVDNGGVMQTEFNVSLPWTKQVSLSSPARGSASVAVVNVGRDVTCSVSVNGAQVRARTGRGLTICTGAA